MYYDTKEEMFKIAKPLRFRSCRVSFHFRWLNIVNLLLFLSRSYFGRWNQFHGRVSISENIKTNKINRWKYSTVKPFQVYWHVLIEYSCQSRSSSCFPLDWNRSIRLNLFNSRWAGSLLSKTGWVRVGSLLAKSRRVWVWPLLSKRRRVRVGSRLSKSGRVRFTLAKNGRIWAVFTTRSHNSNFRAFCQFRGNWWWKVLADNRLWRIWNF